MYDEIIEKLATLLSIYGIPFDKVECYDGWQIIYPNENEWICDAIIHSDSYGHEDGLFEIMGLTENGDEVEGWLSAKDVLDRMRKHYENSI